MSLDLRRRRIDGGFTSEERSDAAEMRQREASIVEHYRSPAALERLLAETRGAPAAPVEPAVRVLSASAQAAIAGHAERYRHGAVEVVVSTGVSPLDEYERTPMQKDGSWDEVGRASRRAAEEFARAKRIWAERTVPMVVGGAHVGAGGMRVVAPAHLDPHRAHFYNPANGRYVGGRGVFPAAAVPGEEIARPEWYVELHEDWTEVDLAGVRWAARRPARYGVHDDGLCACHPPVVLEPPGPLEEEDPVQGPRRRLWGSR